MSTRSARRRSSVAGSSHAMNAAPSSAHIGPLIGEQRQLVSYAVGVEHAGEVLHHCSQLGALDAADRSLWARTPRSGWSSFGRPDRGQLGARRRQHDDDRGSGRGQADGLISVGCGGQAVTNISRLASGPRASSIVCCMGDLLLTRVDLLGPAGAPHRPGHSD